MPGNTTESREQGQGIAATTERNVTETISFQERAGKPGGGKGILIQNERVGTLSTLNNQSVLDKKVYCIQGNAIDRADTAGCNGKGWREDQSYTLNTIDRPAVLSVDEKMGQTYIGEEVGNTLGARDYKQPQAVCTMQSIGEYKWGGVASSLKHRDFKDATDLVIQSAPCVPETQNT